MKKKLVGILSVGILSIGGLTAFADTQVENTGGNFIRGFGRGAGVSQSQSENFTPGEHCLEDEEYRQERFTDISSVLRDLGKEELADSIENGDYETARDAMESLTEEEQLELRDAMRASGLNGSAEGREQKGQGRGQRQGKGQGQGRNFTTR